MALSSCAEIARSMSRSSALHRTVAPASRHTLASVRSGAETRFLSLRERLHAARWRPLLSSGVPHSHRASTTCKSSLALSKIRVRNSPASIRNSNFEGHPHNTSQAPGPECDRRWACSTAHDWFNTTFFLKLCSEDEEA